MNHESVWGCLPDNTPWTEFLTHACENITFPQLLLRTVKSSPTIKTTTSASGAWSTIHLGMRQVLSTCPSCDRYLSLSKMFQDKICNYFLMISIAVIDKNAVCVLAEMLVSFWIWYDLGRTYFCSINVIHKVDKVAIFVQLPMIINGSGYQWNQF